MVRNTNKPRSFRRNRISASQKKEPPNSRKTYNDDGRQQILLISSNCCIGGVEKVVLNLMKTIDREKYHLTVVVTEIEGKLRPDYEAHSDEYYHIPGYGALRTFLLGRRFDVYHIFNAITALGSVDTMDGKVVVSMFGNYRWEGHWYKVRMEWFQKQIEFIDVITTDNPNNIPIFHDFPVHLPNGVIFPRTIRKKRRKMPIIAWAGRESPEKMVSSLVATAADMPDCEFQVAISDLISFSYSMTGIDDLRKLPNTTVFVNANEAVVNKMFDKAMVYFNSSVSEGLPMAMLEAMSYGCIPVVTDVGAMPDAIKTIKEGIVCGGDPIIVRSYKPEIEAALARYMEDPEEMKWEIHNTSKKYFSAKKQAEFIEDIYSGEIVVDKTDLMIKLRGTGLERRQSIEYRFSQFIIQYDTQMFADDRAMCYALYAALFDVAISDNTFIIKDVERSINKKDYALGLVVKFEQSMPPIIVQKMKQQLGYIRHRIMGSI